MHSSLPTLAALLLATAPQVQAQPQPQTQTQIASAARGQSVYQARCSACHSPDFNGAGPAHRGVFGRLAGTAKGFGNYSPALKRSGLIWTQDTLDRWLADPETLVPGQAMGISLPDASERTDVIAFLRTLGAAKQ